MVTPVLHTAFRLEGFKDARLFALWKKHLFAASAKGAFDRWEDFAADLRAIDDQQHCGEALRHISTAIANTSFGEFDELKALAEKCVPLQELLLKHG